MARVKLRVRRLVAIALGSGLAILAVLANAAAAGAGLSSEIRAAAPAGSAAGDRALRCPPEVDRREAAVPADRGLLWRISRDGRSSYLYAALHVGRPAWRAFGPRTTAALAEIDTLALEIDPSDPASVAELGATTRVPPTLPTALAERLARAIDIACLPRAALAPLHPVLQVLTLTMLDARWLGLDAAYSTELLLATRARADGRAVVSLETAALQRSVLLPDDDAAVPALVDQALAQLDDRSSRRVLARLVDAWERGDLQALRTYELWCECAASDDDRAFLRRINDERNPALAAAIAALHDRGRRVFAAVGALHMTGPQALPALLAERGFRVERVPFAP